MTKYEWIWYYDNYKLDIVNILGKRLTRDQFDDLLIKRICREYYNLRVTVRKVWFELPDNMRDINNIGYKRLKFLATAKVNKKEESVEEIITNLINN